MAGRLTFFQNDRAANDRSWQTIAPRIFAATLGAYYFVYWLGCAAALFLPMRRSEAVYLIGLIQILVLAPFVLWIFTTRSISRVLLVVSLGTAVGAIIVRLHA